jgi:secreted trypsin-like serine protease
MASTKSLLHAFKFSVFALLLSSCGNSHFSQELDTSTQTSIVNGYRVSMSDVGPRGFASSVVAVNISFIQKEPQVESKEPRIFEQSCTGTVLSPRIVLTAAHCLYNESTDLALFKISVSFHVLDMSTEILSANLSHAVRIAHYYPNEAYVKSRDTEPVDKSDDLALLLLPEPAASDVTPAALPSGNFDISSVASLTVAGYGNTIDLTDAESGDGVLNYTQFQEKQIRILLQQDFTLTDDGKEITDIGMIYIHAPKTNICHGDSGGPLFAFAPGTASPTLVGVSDFVSPERANPLDFESDVHACLGNSAYVNVTKHLAWIQAASKTLLGLP